MSKKQTLKNKKKALSMGGISCRYYSLNDWLCTIGGFLVCLMLVLLIALVWSHQTFVLKMIATNILLIVLVWLLDRATK